MNLKRDQLRAARMLLHLSQDQLARLATVGVATLRRFEGGQDIGPLHLDALRRAVEDAGAILLAGDPGSAGGGRGVGVALRIESELPEATRARIAGGAAIERPPGARTAGRPRKQAAP